MLAVRLNQENEETRPGLTLRIVTVEFDDVPYIACSNSMVLSFAGKHGHDENLLHFCMRHKLDGMATLLLQPKNIEGRIYYLQQRGYDNKTPIEVARKNDMKRITEIAQGILVGSCALFVNYQPYCNVLSFPLSLNMKANHRVCVAYYLLWYAGLHSNMLESKYKI